MNWSPIVLCGFMGCGKTTLGPLLARRLGRQWIDMDEWIVRETGKTVPELFAQEGEAAFRAREREACRRLADRPDCVISAGGGAMTFRENADCFRRAGFAVVWLRIPLELAAQRLREDAGRPLARDPEALARLFAERQPRYAAAATHAVDCGSDPEENLRRILTALETPPLPAKEELP